MKEELFFGCYGNGTTISNKKVMEGSDWKSLAHISEEGLIKWYAKVSEEAKAKIEEYAKPIFEKSVLAKIQQQVTEEEFEDLKKGLLQRRIMAKTKKVLFNKKIKFPLDWMDIFALDIPRYCNDCKEKLVFSNWIGWEYYCNCCDTHKIYDDTISERQAKR